MENNDSNERTAHYDIVYTANTLDSKGSRIVRCWEGGFPAHREAYAAMEEQRWLIHGQPDVNWMTANLRVVRRDYR